MFGWYGASSRLAWCLRSFAGCIWLVQSHQGKISLLQQSFANIPQVLHFSFLSVSIGSTCVLLSMLMLSVTAWSLQVQFLLQIIINRISLLLTDQHKAMRLKIGVAVLITLINISVYNICKSVCPRMGSSRVIYCHCLGLQSSLVHPAILPTYHSAQSKLTVVAQGFLPGYRSRLDTSTSIIFGIDVRKSSFSWLTATWTGTSSGLSAIVWWTKV